MYTKKLILIGLFAFFLSSCEDSSSEQQEKKPQPILIAEAQKRDLSDTRNLSAPVVAYKRVYITARTAGLVMEVNYEEGDLVRKGQILARLDTRRQQAQLRNAEAALKEAQLHFNRQEILFEQEVITQAEFDNTTVALERAQAEAELWRVEVELGQISSPVSGVVSAKLVEPGTSLNTNDRLFTVEDHTLLVVRPALSELDAARLQKGQLLDLTFDVYGDEVFKGNIRRIFPAADPVTRLFTVEVEIDQKSAEKIIRPGYLARSRFNLDQRKDVIAVPTESVTDRESEKVVFLLSEDKESIKKQVVETGAERDGYIEIKQGLNEGDIVAAGNIERLREGVPVKVSGSFRRYGFRD